MPNLNSIILTGSDHKVALMIPGSGVYPILTASNISWEDAAETEMIYAVGSEYPIGNKQNAFSFKGKLSMQNGEMARILNGANLITAIQIPNAVLSITTNNGPSYTYSGLLINTSSVDVKNKDKESLVSMSWTAIMITN
jgi:hypothetical protein